MNKNVFYESNYIACVLFVKCRTKSSEQVCRSNEFICLSEFVRLAEMDIKKLISVMFENRNGIRANIITEIYFIRRLVKKWYSSFYSLEVNFTYVFSFSAHKFLVMDFPKSTNHPSCS